jgi:8-oxo-dGTP pyrophosphatase MutT (NUDIX family)
MTRNQSVPDTPPENKQPDDSKSDRKKFKLGRPKLPALKNFVKRRPIIEEVVRETTSGGIVFRRDEKTRQLEILLIQDAKDRWTIPKGHVEPNEEPKQTAEREIREETGLQDMKVYNWLGKVNFRYRRAHTLVLMTMHIYLVEGKGDTNMLKGEDWLNDIKWLPASEAVDKIAYEDISKLILVGMKKIREMKL